jgi:hypothetical protein
MTHNFWDAICDGINGKKTIDEVCTIIAQETEKEVVCEVMEQITNMIDSRDLTEEEQRIYGSWLEFESEYTGERLF